MDDMRFYAQFINDPTSLANGYHLIKQYLMMNANHRSFTLQNLFHPQVPIITLVGQVYPCQIFPQLSTQQKQQTRLFLCQTLFNSMREGGPTTRNSKNIINFILKIHKEEGYQPWLDLYTKIIQNMATQHILLFFIQILKNADDRISCLSRQIYAFIMNNFEGYTSALQTDSNHVLEILYYCLKSFVHLVGTIQQEDGQDEPNIQILGGQIMAKALQNFAWSKLTTSLRCSKFSLKLLTVLYGGMSLPINANLANPMLDYGYQMMPQFLNAINLSEQSFGVNFDEEDDDENEPDQGIEYTILFHQFLELTQTMLEASQAFSKQIRVVDLTYLVILSALSMKSQFDFWCKQSDQYLLSTEDESERTLRNRCCQFLGSLLDKYSPHCKKVRQILRNNYQFMFEACSRNSLLEEYQNFINAQISKQIDLTSIQFPERLEEALYFILMSICSQIFKEEEKGQLVFTLGARIMTTPHVLLKIACTQICVAEIKSTQAENSIQFLLQISHAAQNQIGLILAISKGLAKCAISNKIQISETMFNSIIQPLILYLTQSSELDSSQTETVSYIALELLLKLFESSASNKEILKNQLSPNFQMVVIQKYFHDGMVNSIIIELLTKLQNPGIIQFILGKLSTGQIHDEKLGVLVGKWITNKAVTLGCQQICILLHHYKESRRSIIKSTVSSWLSLQIDEPNFKNMINQEFMNMLNDSPDSSWLIYMLRLDILNNGEQLLVRTIKEATNQTSFPSQFENKLTLPFFVGLNYTQKFITLLSGIPHENSNLYEKFMTKFFQYAEYFKGDHLKIVGSLFMLRLCQLDQRLIQKSIEVVDRYGKLEADEWEDQAEDDIDEDELMERLLGAKIVNDQLQKQLQEVFKELAWASNIVQQKLGVLKSLAVK